MSEIKLPRLLAAAKEFNIGRDTLIDFLVKKGFNKEELKDTAKLSEEMYRSLQSEFSSDKAAKNKADLVEIPKAGSGEPRKKRDEEDLSISRKETKETIKIVKEEAAPTPVVVEPVVEEIIIETPVVVVQEEVLPEVIVEPIPEITPEVVVTDTEKKSDTLKIEAPELEGPKIITKIDLSAIDSSTKPKKISKKKKDETVVEAEEIKQPVIVEKSIVQPTILEVPVVAKPKEQKPVEEIFKIPVNPELQTTTEDNQEVSQNIIENIEVEKLSGPKILGKIELPKDNDTRPKSSPKDEIAKRKRIPIDKKGTNIQHVDFRKDDRGGDNRGSQVGGVLGMT